MKVTLVLAVSALFVATALATKIHPRWDQLEDYTFEQYVAHHGKHYEDSEFRFRKNLFEIQLREVREHNANEKNTWKKGINHLSDWTEQEFRATLGYDKNLGYEQSKKRVAQIPESLEAKLKAKVPKSVDWRKQGIVSDVKDQGRCGSCWTFGAAETLESHYALSTGYLADLSQQQILDCVPNVNQCGGTGGCFGGTAQLAWQTLMKSQSKGLATEWTYPYRSYQGANYTCQFDDKQTPTFAQVKGVVTLPANSYNHVLSALAFVGPLAINVDASSWRNYESGVFNGCNQTSPDINHVVQLVGYGTDDHGDYWTVRNSWSPKFGENGYIRLARSSVPNCGVDTKPSDGTGCKGGPPTQTVCGTCGVLFDTSYPLV